MRVVVARGSIAYSQVTQPRPDPLRQRGTPSVTLAVHSTRVWPNSTSTEPSGWMLHPRVIVTGRSSSGARPSGRVMTASLPCGSWMIRDAGPHESSKIRVSRCGAAARSCRPAAPARRSACRLRGSRGGADAATVRRASDWRGTGAGVGGAAGGRCRRERALGGTIGSAGGASSALGAGRAVRGGGTDAGRSSGPDRTPASRRPARPRATGAVVDVGRHGQAQHDPAVGVVGEHGRPVVRLDLLEEAGVPRTADRPLSGRAAPRAPR